MQEQNKRDTCIIKNTASLKNSTGSNWKTTAQVEPGTDKPEKIHTPPLPSLAPNAPAKDVPIKFLFGWTIRNQVPGAGKPRSSDAYCEAMPPLGQGHGGIAQAVFLVQGM